MRRRSWWAALWVLLAALYFCVPLYATLDFSLRASRGHLSLLAYRQVLANPLFVASFLFSVRMALSTILVGNLLLVPTLYWVHLRIPLLRPVVELVSLLPFVVPAVVYVFGLIRTYSRPPFALVTSPSLLVAAYVILAMPYMYRSIDTGLRAIDVRTLTEAAESLGARPWVIVLRVIVPNLRGALLSSAFLCFSIVMGELTMALYLAWPAFGPFMWQIGQNRAYEPAALVIISLLLTWLSIAVIQVVGRGPRGAGAQLGAQR